MTNDKLQQLDNKLRELRKELEVDLLKYGNSYLVIPERCSCGARQKSKCVKESYSGYGKMCVKEFKEQGQTGMDAQQAFEMIENPVEANSELIELLRLE